MSIDIAKIKNLICRLQEIECYKNSTLFFYSKKFCSKLKIKVLTIKANRFTDTNKRTK